MKEEEALSEQKPGAIYAAMAAIMGEIGGVKKTRRNEQQKYQFRGIADITLAAQPLLARHGVILVPHEVLADQPTERETKSGGTMLHVRQRIAWRFYAADGSFIPAVTTGEAMDSGDKASNKAMTAALKYVLVQAFCIPEEDPSDPDEHTPEESRKPEPRIGDAERKMVIETAKREWPDTAPAAIGERLLGICSKLAGHPVARLTDMPVSKLDDIVQGVIAYRAAA